MASGSSTANLPATYIGPKGAESKLTKRGCEHRFITVIAELFPAIHDDFPSGPALYVFQCGGPPWMPGPSPGMTPKMVMQSTWSLHPQLAADAVPVGELALSLVLLSNDANYPWLILVPRRPGLIEIIDLEENEQVQLIGEIAAAARTLKRITECDKLNIAALGNAVPQLHIHVIARRHSDAAWPKPVWGAAPALAYQPAQRDALIATIKRGIKIA